MGLKKSQRRLSPSEDRYGRLLGLRTNRATQASWKKAFGDSDFEKALKATQLVEDAWISDPLPPKSPRFSVSRDDMAQTLADDPELADVFHNTHASLREASFKLKKGLMGFIVLAKGVIKYRKSKKGKELAQEQQKPPSTGSTTDSPSRAAGEDDTLGPSSSDTPPPQEEAVERQDKLWKVFILKASSRKFLIEFTMEDLCGETQPQKQDLNFQRLLKSLDGHPDLAEEDAKSGFLYVDSSRNYPIYSDMTLRFAFEQWRNTASVPTWTLYLEDRPKPNGSSRPRLQLSGTTAAVVNHAVDSTQNAVKREYVIIDD